MPLDPNLNFLSEQRSDSMDFMDLLPPNYAAGTLPPHDSHDLLSSAHEGLNPGHPSYGLGLGSVDLTGGIGFEQNQSSARQSTASKMMHSSFDAYMARQYVAPLEPAESTPSDLSNAASSPEPAGGAPPSSLTPHANHNLTPNPIIGCGCLSSLYLAMDALANLPSDVTTAMRTARNTSKIAHDVINCTFCSYSLVDNPINPPPVQAFQNLMLLAALVPSACNAYALILERVDQEAEAAKEEGRDIWFSLREVSGPFGPGTGEENSQCYLVQTYNEREIPPDMWRAAVKEVVRADVDGVDEQSSGSTCPRLGLRDVIRLLEERSHKRHAIMDAMVESGHMPKHSPYLLYPSHVKKSVPPEQRNCMQVLETARIALDRLVIA